MYKNMGKKKSTKRYIQMNNLHYLRGKIGSDEIHRSLLRGGFITIYLQNRYRMGTMTKDVFEILDSLSIHYERIDHPAVYTSEEARQLVPHRPAKAAKNLFLRDKKGKRHILLVVGDQKNVQFKDIERQTGLTYLSLGSPARLERHLGVTPGAVSLLALVNDSEGKVDVLIDRDLWEGEEIQAHPLVNTATVVMAIADMEQFIEHSGHSIQFVDVA